MGHAGSGKARRSRKEGSSRLRPRAMHVEIFFQWCGDIEKNPAQEKGAERREREGEVGRGSFFPGRALGLLGGGPLLAQKIL